MSKKHGVATKVIRAGLGSERAFERPELLASERRCPRIHRHNHLGGAPMRSIALWLLGVPIPIIILLWFFMR